MRGQGLNDLPRCELERRSSHHKGIFFEVPNSYLFCSFRRFWFGDEWKGSSAEQVSLRLNPPDTAYTLSTRKGK